MSYLLKIACGSFLVNDISSHMYVCNTTMAETNMNFRVRIHSLNGKSSKYPNSLNKPIYHKNAWFMWFM